MNRAELIELIGNGESSGVEFKRDDIRPEHLAKEMAALLNLEGGHILLGVEDNGGIAGLSREPKQVEEWVMEVARTHLRPAAIPFWETIPCGPRQANQSASSAFPRTPRTNPTRPSGVRPGSRWYASGLAHGMQAMTWRPGSICSRAGCNTIADRFPAPVWSIWTPDGSSTTFGMSVNRTVPRQMIMTAGCDCWSTPS